jgi:hypothetical protein
LADDSDRLQDGNIVARRMENFEDDARCACRDFKGRFVGFDIAHGGFGGYGIAFLDPPRTDYAGFNGVALSGHDKNMRHLLFLVAVSFQNQSVAPDAWAGYKNTFHVSVQAHFFKRHDNGIVTENGGFVKESRCLINNLVEKGRLPKN